MCRGIAKQKKIIESPSSRKYYYWWVHILHTASRGSGICLPQEFLKNSTTILSKIILLAMLIQNVVYNSCDKSSEAKNTFTVYIPCV